MNTYYFNWIPIPDSEYGAGDSSGSEAEEISAQFAGQAIKEFFKKFGKQTKGFTFEGSESENQLGLTDIDKSFLEKNGIKLEFGEKPGYIHISSIQKFQI
jgi:hypothetical protein